jgi:hypothetical protein
VPKGGVRLRHPTARSGRFTFSLNKRPYRYPLACPACGTLHHVKTYHIAVDADGFAFISHEIWQQMKKFNHYAGFELANEVASPPAQTVGTGAPILVGSTPLED